jgi:mRNA-degrading endonuclease YafQ of YafQ-DinJ toxin-antitoxin module
MAIKHIYYEKLFLKNFDKLPKKIQLLAHEKVEFFKKDQLHPSLRLHALHGNLEGLWSISVDRHHRIIFNRLAGGDIVFLSIGKHDIYPCL